MIINRILQIDVDSTRKLDLLIRNVQSDPERPDRPLSTDHNPVENLLLLASAMIVTILEAEKSGIYKKGEAMQKAFEYLQALYVDINVETVDVFRNVDTGEISTISNTE